MGTTHTCEHGTLSLVHVEERVQELEKRLVQAELFIELQKKKEDLRDNYDW